MASSARRRLATLVAGLTVAGLTAVAAPAVGSAAGSAAAAEPATVAIHVDAPPVAQTGHVAKTTTSTKKVVKKATKKVVKKKAAKKVVKKKAVKKVVKKVAKKKPATRKKVVKKAAAVRTVGPAPGALDQRALPTDWLGRINAYRAAVGAPPVVELPGLSAQLAAHATYLVRTGATGHDEDPASPWYSAAGAHGGSVSDVLTSSAPMSDAAVVDQFVSAPFHAFALLDPQLAGVAFASFGDPSSASGNDYAAALDVIDGEQGGRYLSSSPALWPSNGSVVTTTSAPDEWPNPTSGCPGGPIDSSQQGTLLWAMLGQFPAGLLQAPAETPVSGATLTADDGSTVPVCVVTQDNWHAGDPRADSTGRIWLNLVDGVIVVPLHPLAHGTRYHATITGPTGTLADWSFAVA